MGKMRLQVLLKSRARAPSLPTIYEDQSFEDLLTGGVISPTLPFQDFWDGEKVNKNPSPLQTATNRQQVSSDTRGGQKLYYDREFRRWLPIQPSKAEKLQHLGRAVLHQLGNIGPSRKEDPRRSLKRSLSVPSKPLYIFR